MNFITKEELEKKDIVSKVDIINGRLVLPKDFEYKSEFEVGDIVIFKDNIDKIGVVDFIEDEEINVYWNDGDDSREISSNLTIIPPSLGLKVFKENNIIALWESLSNGKNESFDLKCLYVQDEIINEVPFIKAFKNTTTLVDKKFKRGFTLYRKFGNTQIFRTNLYTLRNNEVIFDTSRYVYYLLENHIVYYLGIDLDEKDLATYLFNR